MVITVVPCQRLAPGNIRSMQPILVTGCSRKSGAKCNLCYGTPSVCTAVASRIKYARRNCNYANPPPRRNNSTQPRTHSESGMCFFNIASTPYGGARIAAILDIHSVRRGMSQSVTASTPTTGHADSNYLGIHSVRRGMPKQHNASTPYGGARDCFNGVSRFFSTPHTQPWPRSAPIPRVHRIPTLGRAGRGNVSVHGLRDISTLDTSRG